MKPISLFFIGCLLFSSVACKKEKKANIISGGIQRTDERLETYIETFVEYHVVASGQEPDLTGISVVFSDTMASNQLGSCTMNTGLVKINRSLWAVLGAGSREELIFHELGHCVLGRLHDNTLVNGVPASIMNAYHLGTTYTRADLYSKYVAELFIVPNNLFAGINFNPSNYVLASLALNEEIMPLHQENQPVYRCMDED